MWDAQSKLLVQLASIGSPQSRAQGLLARSLNAPADLPHHLKPQAQPATFRVRVE
jgi:hypothetical protein